MRRASNVKAGTARSANAFFTMIALVENKTAPINVMIKPATGITLLLSTFFNGSLNILTNWIFLKPPLQGRLVELYTLTLKSLRASFKLVFKSVLGLRLPMIRAQLTPNEPAGKSLL